MTKALTTWAEVIIRFKSQFHSSLFNWLWWWLPLKMSKRQSPLTTTVHHRMYTLLETDQQTTQSNVTPRFKPYTVFNIVKKVAVSHHGDSTLSEVLSFISRCICGRHQKWPHRETNVYLSLKALNVFVRLRCKTHKLSHDTPTKLGIKQQRTYL